MSEFDDGCDCSSQPVCERTIWCLGFSVLGNPGFHWTTYMTYEFMESGIQNYFFIIFSLRTQIRALTFVLLTSHHSVHRTNVVKFADSTCFLVVFWEPSNGEPSDRSHQQQQRRCPLLTHQTTSTLVSKCSTAEPSFYIYRTFTYKQWWNFSPFCCFSSEPLLSVCN